MSVLANLIEQFVGKAIDEKFPDGLSLEALEESMENDDDPAMLPVLGMFLEIREMNMWLASIAKSLAKEA